MADLLPQPYHVYLDLDVVNNDVESGAQPHPLVFEEVRNTPFLDGDCSNYFCSIFRFSIQTGSSLPVFIPRMDTAALASGDLYKTAYKISLNYRSRVITQNVIFNKTVSSAFLGSTPTNLIRPSLTSYNVGPFYHVYNYQDFVDMINTTLGNLWTALVASYASSVPGELSASTYPFMEFDPGTNECTLFAEKSVFGSTPGVATPAQIIFNSRLFELFPGYQHMFLGYDGDLNYTLKMNNRGSNLASFKNAAGTITYTYVQSFQEVSGVALWNPVASLVFCSSMLPILPTQTSKATVISNQQDNLTSNGNNNNLSNVLSDFQIAIEGSNQYRPIILYAPQSEYRLVDLFAGSNLNRINIQVFWKDHFGNLNPFLLEPGASAHMKLMVRRRAFYIA